ncbi:VanZ family protein [Paenibacillus riograndensis]|uniref:VanZ family protein n=1 Tax=Paenibacillus riograndensis TaxID=483937 RepID=UPI003D15E426
MFADAFLWENGINDFFASFSIEFVQYFLGAAADIDDVILNLLGGILGYVLFAGGSRYLQRKQARLKLSGGNHYR